MSSRALEALRQDREALLVILKGLDHKDFASPSGCAGWSTQDVVSHMGGLFWMVVDPSSLPDTTGLPTERAQDVIVEERRSWGPDQVVADYETVSASALEALAGLEGQDFELALGDLGTYPADLLINAFSFDHYTHIRADLFAPRGTLTGTPPPSDELRLAPAVDWPEAAIVQQNSGLIADMKGSVAFDLRGPGSRTIVVGDGEPQASIACDTAGFILAITNRSTWDDIGASQSGDPDLLEVARSIHVF
jgi:uncharacterized protein (TIGR03083 family)